MFYENLNAAQSQEYLIAGSAEEEAASVPSSPVSERAPSSRGRSLSLISNGHAEKPEYHEIPTLALAPYQFRMIQALDNVGFRKYPVYIHKNRHSHAAIIVRAEKPSFDEGRVVLRHWLDEEFIL